MWGTLPEVFDRVCLYYAESTAIRDHDRSITYREMRQWANRVANGLGALGVALYSYAVPTRDLEGATLDDRQAFAAQLRAVFVRRAPVPNLPPPLAAVAR